MYNLKNEIQFGFEIFDKYGYEIEHARNDFAMDSFITTEVTFRMTDKYTNFNR